MELYTQARLDTGQVLGQGSSRSHCWLFSYRLGPAWPLRRMAPSRAACAARA